MTKGIHHSTAIVSDAAAVHFYTALLGRP